MLMQSQGPGLWPGYTPTDSDRDAGECGGGLSRPPPGVMGVDCNASYAKHLRRGVATFE